MFHKRKFTPTNPNKYSGDPTNIIMRSSWETKFANWCDMNPSVVTWKSEETIIPYRCQTDNRIHRYFVDFQIRQGLYCQYFGAVGHRHWWRSGHRHGPDEL